MNLTSLHQEPINSVPKRTKFKSVKLSQKQMGDISPSVRAEVHVRSGGICEVKELCNGAVAVNQAHLKGRRIIERKTTADDLLDSCYACHKYLDETVEGIKQKRKLREGA